MIRGVIYLTGLVTLTVVGLTAAFALRVHKLPWKDYVQTGRRELAETLDPADDPARDEGAPPEARVPAERPPQAPRRPHRREDPTCGPRSEPSAGPRVVRRRVVNKRVTNKHVVERNETLYAIAQRYYGAGERWHEIARANGIRKPSDLCVGRVIVIPYGVMAYEENPIWAPDLRLRLTPALEGARGRAGEGFDEETDR